MKAFQLAWASMQPDSNRKLYKFSGPTEYALQNLENGVIFCQHYSAYNDPFEFWSKIHEGIPDPRVEPERFLAAAAAWGFPANSVNELMANEVFAENFEEYFEECSDYQPPFKKLRDQMRIACFGSNQESLLMWSHYGDGLRGFCIAFDESELVDHERGVFLVDVHYADAPPVADAFIFGIAKDQAWYHEMAIEEATSRALHFGTSETIVEDYECALKDASDLSDQTLQTIFAAKPLDWCYERERRLLVQTDREDEAPILLNFPFGAIKEIFVGERMPLDYRRRLEAILLKTCGNVPIATARRSTSNYRLEMV